MYKGTAGVDKPRSASGRVKVKGSKTADYRWRKDKIKRRIVIALRKDGYALINPKCRIEKKQAQDLIECQFATISAITDKMWIIQIKRRS